MVLFFLYNMFYILVYEPRIERFRNLQKRQSNSSYEMYEKGLRKPGLRFHVS